MTKEIEDKIQSIVFQFIAHSGSCDWNAGGPCNCSFLRKEASLEQELKSLVELVEKELNKRFLDGLTKSIRGDLNENINLLRAKYKSK